jgi:hypothetical protein
VNAQGEIEPGVTAKLLVRFQPHARRKVMNYRPSGNIALFLLWLAFPSSATAGKATMFLTARAFSVAASPAAVAAGDFNGDGKLDVATANADGSVSVLLNKGNGTFNAAVNYTAGLEPTSIAVGDFNGDGKLDLVVANCTCQRRNPPPGSVSVFLGNGDGTFQAAMNYVTGSSPQSVAVGDFNGDGKPDLAVANYTANTVSILLGNGDGSFRAGVDHPVRLPLQLAVGDFNGDGTLQPARHHNTGPSPGSLAVGDFNGDAKLDEVTANNDGT